MTLGIDLSNQKKLNTHKKAIHREMDISIGGLNLAVCHYGGSCSILFSFNSSTFLMIIITEVCLTHMY